MYKAPVHSIKTPPYQIDLSVQLSGEVHINQFGQAFPIEYWNAKPDFKAISEPIIQFMKQHFLDQRIGMRFLASTLHPKKTQDELIATIQSIGHDRYDQNRVDNLYQNKDLRKTEIFILEIDIGTYEGIHGEEQIMHALNSVYFYSKIPVKVDVITVYDLTHFELLNIVYDGETEPCHVFKQTHNKHAAVLSILKLI